MSIICAQNDTYSMGTFYALRIACHYSKKNSGKTQFQENIYKSNLQYVFAIYYVIEGRMLRKSTMNIRCSPEEMAKNCSFFAAERKKERKKNVIKNRTYKKKPNPDEHVCVCVPIEWFYVRSLNTHLLPQKYLSNAIYMKHLALLHYITFTVYLHK